MPEENNKNMNNLTQDYLKKLARVFEPRAIKTNNYQLIKISEAFTLAWKSIVKFYLLMSENEGGEIVLNEMFGRASDTQLDNANKLLIFWFFWQRDWVRNLNFLSSGQVRDGLKEVWDFSGLEINNLKQEFNNLATSNPGAETARLWEKLQNILENHDHSPIFAFPALSISLKMYWTQLDLSIGDYI